MLCFLDFSVTRIPESRIQKSKLTRQKNKKFYFKKIRYLQKVRKIGCVIKIRLCEKNQSNFIKIRLLCYYCQIVMFKKKALLYKKNFCLPNSKFFSPAAVTALMGKEMKTFPSNKKTTFWCVQCRVSFNLILLLLCYYFSNNKKIVIYRSTYWSTQRTTAISCKLYSTSNTHRT